MEIIKPTTLSYNIPFSFEGQMIDGETIRSFNITTTGDIVVDNGTKVGKDILVNISAGTTTSSVTVDVVTNKVHTPNLNKTLNITIDDSFVTSSYNDLIYYPIVDGNDCFIVLGSTLTTNTEYIIDIKKGLPGTTFEPMIEPYQFWFTTQYCPLFATITKVRMLAGPFIESFTDDTINRYIYRNSLYAVDIYNANMGTSVPYDYFGCGPDGIPEELRSYVECKTAYDLLSIIAKMSGTGLSQSKHLGDMTISYTGSGTGSNGDDPRKDLYDCFNDLTNKIGRGLNVAVRGIYNTSKNFAHPVMEPERNRVLRPMLPQQVHRGPWRPSPVRTTPTPDYGI